MKELKIYLQLFAENGKENEETVVEETTEQAEEFENEDADFEDSEQEQEENEQEQEEKPVSKKTQKNTKAENMLNAQRRLEEKRIKREQEIARNTKLDTVKKISGGKNRFTGEPIVDEFDVQEYELMLELEAQGKDVLEEYPKVVKERQRQERIKAQKELEEKEQAQQKIANDLTEFNNKYGEELAKEILQDEDFVEFADDLLGNIPLTTIYERYQRQNERINKQVEEKILKKEARKRSSPGVPGKTPQKAMSFNDMTPEEFHEFVMGVAKRY